MSLKTPNKISSNIMATKNIKVNMDSNTFKDSKKNVGLKLKQKANWINQASFDAFDNIITSGNRESIRPINDLLDGLQGKPVGKKVSIATLEDFKQQKGMKVIEKNLGGAMTTVYFHLPKKTNIYNEAFSKVKSAIEVKLTKILNFKRAMKVHLAMEVTFIKTVVIDDHVEITEETKPIKLLPTTFTSEREIRKGVQVMRSKLEYKLDNFLLEGTEWKIKSINHFFIVYFYKGSKGCIIHTNTIAI